MVDVEINNDSFRIPAGRIAEVVLILKNTGEKREKVKVKMSSELHMDDPSLEWGVRISGVGKEEEHILVTAEEPLDVEYEVSLTPQKRKEVYVDITSPKAAEIGNYGIFKFLVISDGVWSKDVKIVVEPAIVAIKTTIGQEIKVARDIGLKAKINGWKDIFAVLAPYDLKGYVLVETSRPDKVLSLIRGIKDAKGIVKGEMHLEEVKHYLTPTPTITRISVGDLVEIVEGPFKGEHAKVMQIDEAKNEITVELLEAMMPIPITVKAEAVRLLEKEGE